MILHDEYDVAVLAGMAYEWPRRKRPARATNPAKPGRLLTLALGVAALLALLIARDHLIHLAALDPRGPDWLRRLPIVAIHDSMELRESASRQLLAMRLGIVSLLSSIALLFVYRDLRSRGPRTKDRVLIGAGFALMLAAALLAPAASSTDMDLYASYGSLGTHAYATQDVPVPCPDPSPLAWCRRTAVPALYGPLYLNYVWTLLHGVSDLAQRLTLLRITNACWFVALLWLLSRLGCAPPLIAIAALNPALLTHYVSDAHNDLLGIDAIALATLLARRSPLAGLVVGTAAGLIKLPLALLGATAFLDLPLRRRLLWIFALCLSTLAASLLWGGSPYISSLLASGKEYHFFSTPVHQLVFVATIAGLAASFVRGTTWLSVGYAAGTLGGRSPYPWYAIWALPYLWRNPAKLAAFLILLPTTSFLMETPFQIWWLWGLVLATLTGLAIVELLRGERGGAGRGEAMTEAHASSHDS